MTQVTLVQNKREEKSGKRLCERLNESTGQPTPNRKRSSTLKEVKRVRRTAEATDETHVALIMENGSGIHKEDMEGGRGHFREGDIERR